MAPVRACEVARTCDAVWGKKLKEAKGQAQLEREKQMGIKSTHPEVRRILREHPDGLTTKELAEKMGRELKHLHVTLRAMPDAYIDRWVQLKPQAQWSAVWCVVDVPQDCPRPDRRWIKGRRVDGLPRNRTKDRNNGLGVPDWESGDSRKERHGACAV
jgi:hypothetical protein